MNVFGTRNSRMIAVIPSVDIINEFIRPLKSMSLLEKCKKGYHLQTWLLTHKKPFSSCALFVSLITSIGEAIHPRLVLHLFLYLQDIIVKQCVSEVIKISCTPNIAKTRNAKLATSSETALRHLVTKTINPLSTITVLHSSIIITLIIRLRFFCALHTVSA